jgi:hypothetical protein
LIRPGILRSFCGGFDVHVSITRAAVFRSITGFELLAQVNVLGRHARACPAHLA